MSHKNKDAHHKWEKVRKQAMAQLEAEKQKQLENRRKFVADIKDPKVRALAIREFAKLGLRI